MPEPARDADSITQVLMQDGNRVTLRARKVRVEAIAGPAANLVELPGPEIGVGNSRGADVILLDGAVSRHHLTLRVETAGIRVIDAGSRNGTAARRCARSRRLPCAPDSSLVVGNSTLRLRMLRRRRRSAALVSPELRRAPRAERADALGLHAARTRGPDR